jgi:hypothetical protein
MSTIAIITLTALGGTIDLNDYGVADAYVVQGNVTLTSNLTIGSTASTSDGLSYKIFWRANVALGGNTVTVFGIPLRQATVANNSDITVLYTASSYGVVVASSSGGSGYVDTAALLDGAVTTAKINDAAVTTAKLGSGSVVPSKQDEAVRLGSLVVSGSFETDEQGNTRIYFAFKCRLRFMSAAVVKALSATDPGVITVTTVAGSPSGNVINLSASAAIGTTSLTTLGGAGAEVLGDQQVTINFSKATAGGKAQVTLIYEKID